MPVCFFLCFPFTVPARLIQPQVCFSWFVAPKWNNKSKKNTEAATAKTLQRLLGAERHKAKD